MTLNPLEKLHTVIEDIPELSGNTSWPILNSPAQVSKIVRKFASEVINNGFSGEMNKDQFVTWSQRQAKNLNHTFLNGRPYGDKNYRVGVWNKPENLGFYILKKLTLNGQCHTAVEFLFLIFINEVMTIMKRNEPKVDEAVKAELDRLCNQARDLLLGVCKERDMLIASLQGVRYD